MCESFPRLCEVRKSRGNICVHTCICACTYHIVEEQKEKEHVVNMHDQTHSIDEEI